MEEIVRDETADVQGYTPDGKRLVVTIKAGPMAALPTGQMRLATKYLGQVRLGARR